LDLGLHRQRYVGIGSDFGAVLGGEFARIDMKRFRPVVNDKEKEDADEQIKSQRVHITHTAPSQELLSQMPGTHNQPSDRCKKLRVPIQEGIKNIGNDMTNGTAVVDRGLSALGA